jgi:hypothetical protein
MKAKLATHHLDPDPAGIYDLNSELENRGRGSNS